MLIIILVLVLSLKINVFSDSVFPTSPCPNTFSYERTAANEVLGVVRFKNDFSGYYKVEVNMTLAAFTNTNIAIRRSSSTHAVQNGDDIIFHVMFPPANVLPKVASIVFNDKLYCSVARPQEAGGVTTLNAVHYFSTPIISKGSLSKPYTQYSESADAFDSQSHTSAASVTFPNSSQPTSAGPNINAIVDLIQVTNSLPQTSTSVTIVDSMHIGSSSKFNIHSSIPVKVTEKIPSTSTAGFKEITNRLLEELRCGMTEDTQALLVHGSPTTEDQHPWLIAMFHLQESSGEYKFKCAANLISNKHVISAAHCVRTHRSAGIPKDNIILVLGKHNIRSWAVRSEIRNVEEIHIHPEYKQPSDADVAVIVMSKTVEFTSIIQPICLWGEDTSLDLIVGSNGTVVGWGKDESDNAFVSEPKELNMPIASQEDCLRSDERFIKITSNRTFCAGSRNGEGVCTGDSGGGFIIRRRGKWTLRGIVSSALVDPLTRSCDVNNYMVFADVAKVMSWISRIMAK